MRASRSCAGSASSRARSAARSPLACGDVFESSQIERRTLARALEAIASIPVPVYLLPGNHDPLDAASVYHSAVFRDARTRARARARRRAGRARSRPAWS